MQPCSLVCCIQCMYLSSQQFSGHNDLVGPIKFNPRFMSFASADTSLAMWIPSVDDTF